MSAIVGRFAGESYIGLRSCRSLVADAFHLLLLFVISPTSSVPALLGLAVAQASLYDVPGGTRAIIFDRFQGESVYYCDVAAAVLMAR